MDISVGARHLERLVGCGRIEVRLHEEEKPQIRITSEGVRAFKEPKR
jgi:hypothetical protein